VRLVLVEPLDRETSDTHRLTVVAYDGASPSRSGAIDVTVIVLDSNDNAPVFTRNSYEV